MGDQDVNTGIWGGGHNSANNNQLGDFPGGTVDKHPSVNAGGMSTIPGPGRCHVMWSSEAQAPQLLNLHSLRL